MMWVGVLKSFSVLWVLWNCRYVEGFAPLLHV